MIGVTVFRKCWKIFHNLCCANVFLLLLAIFCYLCRVIQLMQIDENNRCYSIQNVLKSVS